MVTIFTPVYNRAYILHKLYESLKKQTDFGFEWIIVDDGSTDNLADMVKQWKKETCEFPIRYHYQENGGKHRAINAGVKMACSEAFFIVDSDDFLTEDAVEFINNNFPQIMHDKQFAGISGLRSHYRNHTVIGQQHGCDIDATNLERQKYNLLGDKAEVYKTSVLRNYPFPEFEGENFISETVVWNKIAYAGLKIRWFNRVLYYTEYLKDGLTRNLLKLQKDSLRGWAECIKGTRKYYGDDSECAFREMYRYYESMHLILSKEEICRLLEISDGKYEELENKWFSILLKIKNNLLQNKVSNMAVYGVGGVTGKRFLLYLEELGFEISYGIDRNYQEVDFKPTYGVDEALPCVDSICITMKYTDESVMQKLKEYMPGAYIWSVKEIDDKLW